MPYARGSSTTTAVLLEAVRSATAPAAILTTGDETFFALASIVAEEMYGAGFPVIRISPADLQGLKSGMEMSITEDGTIRLTDEGRTDEPA